MAYATVDDLVRRFGEVEITRLTTPAGQDIDGIVADVAAAGLEAASSLMDSYLRKRYQTPLEIAPPEIVYKCCDIARYELSSGDGKSPSDEIRQRQKDALDWLRDIAVGKVVLDLQEVAIGDESYAQAATRDPVFL